MKGELNRQDAKDAKVLADGLCSGSTFKGSGRQRPSGFVGLCWALLDHKLYKRASRTAQFQPVLTGFNRFKPILTYFFKKNIYASRMDNQSPRPSNARRSTIRSQVSIQRHSNRFQSFQMISNQFKALF